MSRTPRGCVVGPVPAPHSTSAFQGPNIGECRATVVAKPFVDPKKEIPKAIGTEVGEGTASSASSRSIAASYSPTIV
jgi:hypothetical protein